MHQTNAIVKVYRRVALSEPPSDFAYWQNQPPAARLAALEAIRRKFHCWRDGTQAPGATCGR